MGALILLILSASGTFNLTEKYIKTYLYFKRNSFTIPKFEKDNKRVLLIPMVHLNTKEYYKNVKHKIDSLRTDGYVFFYEGIDCDEENNTDIDYQMRKFRKITGFTLMNYFDEDNEADNHLKIEGMVFQGDINYGLRKSEDINADYSLTELIKNFENDKEIILLNDCDFSTPLGKKYDCASIDPDKSTFLIEDLRNNYLYNAIIESVHPKIAVVYGSAHTNWLHNRLRERGWHFFNQFHPDYRK